MSKEKETLAEIAARYCCDKLYNHSYIPVYEQWFRDLPVQKLLEIGIGYEDLMRPFVPTYVHGASLKMWRDYFPNAQITGCDIRLDTLFQDERIRSVIVDQSDPFDLLGLVHFDGGEWDIVIDDGSHETVHQIVTAKTLFPYMASKGIYVIEDVREPGKLEKALGHLGWLRVFKMDKRPDDCLVVIRKRVSA